VSDENETPADDAQVESRSGEHVEVLTVTGTGTPATSPNFGVPRFSANDPADFPTQANAITDTFDAQAALRGAIVDADIAAGAAISKAKLAALGIVDADVAVGAAINQSKLALDIVDANVDPAAAIQESKLALATDAAPGVGSRRTLGTGSQQALPGNATPANTPSLVNLKPTSQTASYAASVGDLVIMSASGKTVTLPSAPSISGSQVGVIANGYDVTVNRSGSDTIQPGGVAATVKAGTSTVFAYSAGVWYALQSAGGGLSGVVAAVTAAPVLDVGVQGQLRAGRQLAVNDFTMLGLSAPIALWNLSDLTDASGNGRALSNKGAVPFGPGINGLSSTAAVFAGSTGQALYISDTGASDPFRIKTGSWGCWVRTAKTGTQQFLVAKWAPTDATAAWGLVINTGNTAATDVDSGTGGVAATGVTTVTDDRWHFIVGTHDGTTVRLYVDGVLDAAAAAAFTCNPGSAVPVNVGAFLADGATAASAPHYGRIDEAFVTADVLSEDQIRALYCARIAHGYPVTPTVVNLGVRRARKGGPFAVTDFPTQPLRLYNFTAGALSDGGSNGQTLTNNGGATVVQGAGGAQGGAFNFVGASSQSLSATDSGLPGGTAVRSYGCWFKTTDATNTTHGVIGWAGASTELLYVNSGTLDAACNGDFIQGPYVSDGQWHLAILVEDPAAGDGVKRKMYIDGRLAGSSTVLNSIALSGTFRIGANSDGTNPFTGQVDGVFVCGYALTQDQISTLYAKGSMAMTPSPKNTGDHLELIDATNLYAVFDGLDTQNTIDLAVSG
jgi:Concanavalin A-like lectin/glucanases superfamily